MSLAPSEWVRRWSHLVPQGGSVLDVACGSGRHVRWFAEHGHAVTGADRDAAATAPLLDIAEIVVADIESGPWPFTNRQFDALIVTNYLWRSIFPPLLASLKAGGVLIYETFAHGNQTVGKPSNPDFLLQNGELLQLTAGLRVIAYEDGFLEGPPRFVQRIAAVKLHGGESAPPRHVLTTKSGT